MDGFCSQCLKSPLIGALPLISNWAGVDHMPEYGHKGNIKLFNDRSPGRGQKAAEM